MRGGGTWGWPIRMATADCEGLRRFRPAWSACRRRLIPLADAVVLVATAPKSNSAYNGINAAMADVKAGNLGPIPRQLQNQHTDGAEVKAPGQNYLYPH